MQNNQDKATSTDEVEYKRLQTKKLLKVWTLVFCDHSFTSPTECACPIVCVI